jgi:DNA-directed RNA polymerase subunit K/omega
MVSVEVANAFEFVVLASLRVRQLVDGCTPRVDGEGGKVTSIAQREVLAGKILKIVPVVTPTGPARDRLPQAV